MLVGIVLGIFFAAAAFAFYLWMTDRGRSWSLPEETPPSPAERLKQKWQSMSQTERNVWLGMVAVIGFLLWILGMVSPGFRLGIWIVWFPLAGIGLWRFYQ